MMLGILFLLTGCRIELYSNLSEQEANQMLALLKSNNIDADKVTNKDGSLMLRVDENAFVNAVETLRQYGYPKKKFVSTEDFFPSGQLISSPAQEKTRINYLKEQSLERMLNNIEGVIGANVVIGQEVAEAGFNAPIKPSVSVLVRYSPEINLKAFTVQIRSLVLNAVPGMPDENVALMMQPVSQRVLIQEENVDLAVTIAAEPTTKNIAQPANSRWLWGVVGIGVMALLATIVYVFLGRKRNARHA